MNHFANNNKVMNILFYFDIMHCHLQTFPVRTILFVFFFLSNHFGNLVLFGNTPDIIMNLIKKIRPGSRRENI